MFAASKTAGAAAATAANYIEDVFSTYLYTGNGSTQTITNGIDLAGEGGLVWLKGRSSGNHILQDTVRGANNYLMTDSTAATQTLPNTNFVFGSSGFSMNNSYLGWNANTNPYASWTFRKQPKFFDVVTYTGNGASTQNISHNLGSEPGCIIVKCTSNTNNWYVYHRGLATPNNRNLLLNLTNAATNNGVNVWNVTSTTFEANLADLDSNVNGATYVAYLFAHDAGGFGLTGTDNVISCGSYTGNGSTSGPTVTLGYEPQWVMIKRTDSTGNWVMIDSMRGFVNSTTASPSDAYLVANTSAAESTWGDFTGTSNAAIPLATGFQIVTSTATLNANAGTYIYIAIRRGPMKVPTSGTSVFSPVTRAGTSAAASVSSVGFPPDLTTLKVRNGGSQYNFIDRLRGREVLYSTSTMAAIALNPGVDTAMESNIGFSFIGPPENVDCNYSGLNDVYHNFRRAPGFFDEVCYTGNDVLRTINHNLGVAPEMMIIKCRDSALDWAVYHTGIGNTKYIFLNSTAASVTASSYWNDTSPTASVFTVNTSNKVNSSPSPYVAYLFATCANVSKVGSYTGNGSTQTIDCGFTGGARFVLIKRTDSTGDWYVWDSARGIVAGNDPYLLLNSTAAEVTSTDYVDTYSAGFEITSTAPAAINASGGTFIFLAIA